MSSGDSIFITFTMDVERIAERSPTGGPVSWEQSERAIRGFADVLTTNDLVATLFITPETATVHPQLFFELEQRGFELGMHLHPQSFRDNSYREHLGGYGYEQQVEILSQAQNDWAEALGRRSASFRPGHFSANDATFRALYDCGFRQGSVSPPERQIPSLRSVWRGADPDAHHAHPSFRLIAGDLDFYECPMTVDADRRIYDGDSALEFRIEWGTAEELLSVVAKRVDDLVERDVAVKSLVSITHNMFEFEDPDDAYRHCLDGVSEGIRRVVEPSGLTLVPATLAEVHARADLDA
jgi:hypothetical protein